MSLAGLVLTTRLSPDQPAAGRQSKREPGAGVGGAEAWPDDLPSPEAPLMASSINDGSAHAALSPGRSSSFEVLPLGRPAPSRWRATLSASKVRWLLPDGGLAGWQVC
jgi:hypothetical protein